MKRLLWVLAVCVLAVLGLRAFVFDLYHVTSASMVPSLYPGEVVLVRYDRSRPSRLEPVVFEHGDEYVVKRAAGIGGSTGEDIRIDSKGDLRVGGKYLDPAVARPRVLLFDQTRHAIDEFFAHGGSRNDPWREAGAGVLELDARDVLEGQESGLLRYHPKLLDHYLDHQGRLVEGSFPVHDAEVEFEVRALVAGGRLRVGLREEGDTFWLVVDLAGPQPRIALARENGDGLTVLVEDDCALDVAEWALVTFANVDNHLAASYGSVALSADFERNTPATGPRLTPGASIGERVKLGGEGCHLEVRGIRLWRDLHYTDRGEFGVGTRLTVDAGKLFLLGDNSAHSHDSREYGLVDEAQLVGRPVLVVWPPSAMRWLR
ncbi:MAG: S26 family signal peptidase [Planctomycetota bacterium]|nr:S26 family signal peptidase [Planctomycetota bacterium]